MVFADRGSISIQESWRVLAWGNASIYISCSLFVCVVLGNWCSCQIRTSCFVRQVETERWGCTKCIAAPFTLSAGRRMADVLQPVQWLFIPAHPLSHERTIPVHFPVSALWLWRSSSAMGDEFRGERGLGLDHSRDRTGKCRLSHSRQQSLRTTSIYIWCGFFPKQAGIHTLSRSSLSSELVGFAVTWCGAPFFVWPHEL